MKTSDLREKSIEDLGKELLALLREQINLRIQQVGGQVSKPHLRKNVRLNIARIKTILHEKGSKV